MNRKITLHTLALLLPAFAVAGACTFGLLSHSADTLKADRLTASLAESTSESVPDSSAPVSETAEAESTEVSQSSTGQSPLLSSQKPTASETENNPSPVSKALDKVSPAPKAESSREQVSERNEISRPSEISSVKELSEEYKAEPTDVSESEISQAQREQSAPSKESSSQTASEGQSLPYEQSEKPAEPSVQESHEPSVHEPSTKLVEHEESSETPVVSDGSFAEPTGGYIDGTYKAVAEVDGFEEEGFLYDLEITVTVSGGEITAITGRIKNDRSDDPEANEAYVRRAVKKLSDAIIIGQSTENVDVITNATYSSGAVLKATAEALSQAER
ncbi:MAG: FMN-binding protein [Acutalibacteraceae bacterium]|nr:FMN-binding protein [Acutalibacteraceae bacterium]